MNPNANEFKFNVTASEWNPHVAVAAATDSLTAPISSARAATPTRARLAATPATQDPAPVAITAAPIKPSVSPPASGIVNLIKLLLLLSLLSFFFF